MGVSANFAFGGLTTINRKFNIKVTQYDCMDQENGGPTGCLQYFTAPAGLVSSYNYPIGAAAVVNAVAGSATNFQHLNNQNYAICFRRGANICALCFSPDVRTAVIDQSFGLSTSAIAAMSETDAACTTDYLAVLLLLQSAQVKYHSGYVLLLMLTKGMQLPWEQ